MRYEYKCSKCGDVEIDVRPISKRDDSKKHHCGGFLIREISQFNLIGFDKWGRSKK